MLWDEDAASGEMSFHGMICGEPIHGVSQPTAFPSLPYFAISTVLRLLCRYYASRRLPRDFHLY